MRYHITFNFALVSVAIFSSQAASLTLDQGCKFKTENGKCVTVTEKPIPNDTDVYCKEYYEFSGRPTVPLVPREGSHPALPLDFPHAAAIGFINKNNDINWECSGALISKKHVLATADCLRNSFTGEAKFVRLGDLNVHLNEAGPYRQDFNIQQIFVHPDYKEPEFYHNIGIAQLDKPVDVNPYAVPACLNTKVEIPIEKSYTVIGWGRINGPREALRKLVLNIVENGECRKMYERISVKFLSGIEDSLYICAGGPKTCSAETNGPLQEVNDKGVAIVYGFNSIGPAPCEAIPVPNVYTRVSNYVSWIKSIIE